MIVVLDKCPVIGWAIWCGLILDSSTVRLRNGVSVRQEFSTVRLGLLYGAAEKWIARKAGILTVRFRTASRFG